MTLIHQKIVSQSCVANVDKILILLLQYIIHQYVLKVKLKKD